LEDGIHLIVAARDFERPNRLVQIPTSLVFPDRTDSDVYVVGADRNALFDQIGSEMYAVARPNSHWQSKSTTAPAP